MSNSARSFRLVWPILLAFILAACVPAPSWCSSEYRAVTILHTNDTHDHLLPFSYPDPINPRLGYASMPVIKNIGGIARRATLARQIESEMRGNTLLVDAGDIVDGTPLSVEYGGEADFAAVSAAGYDIMTLGNHEFGVSLEELNQNIRIASFPIVCANLVDRKSGKLLLPPYAIYDFEGAKIAVFGLTTPSPEYKAAKDGLDFLDPCETAKKLVPELKKRADIVIALSHLGSAEDEKLAKAAPGIDVIVGGHSHARLATPKFIPQTDQPHAFWVGGTVIVQAYEKGAELGRLDLRLRRDQGPYTLMSYTGRLLPITSEIPEDPATARVVARYYEPVSKYYGEVIGEATATLYDDRSRESTVLALVCDSIREAAGTQIAIYGVGGIRGNILEGPIKVWDAATVLPFKNKLVVLEMTGGEIKEVLKRFLVKPGVSGMRYRMVGDRVVEATIDGKPIEDSATYRVATIDWLVGLYFAGVSAGEELDITSLDAVVNYIKAHKTISPVADGRRNVQ